MHKKPWNLAGVIGTLLGIGMPVWGEMVPLPYQVPDQAGNIWVVYYQGNLQMQGNQPVFSQAGTIQINGRPSQPQGQQGNWDDKNQELTLKLRSQGNYNHERRVKFMENGVVRVVDLVENTTPEEQIFNIQLSTLTNYGVNKGDLVRDPKGKGELGWVADTAVGRTAMSVFGGKGSKLQPDIQYQQGNNQVIALFKAKIPGKQKIGLVSWHGTFDTSEQAMAWVNQAKESRLTSDLPTEIQKVIVNISRTSAGMIGDREVLRGDNQDVLELKSDDRIRGTVQIEKYDLKTGFGEIELPAEKVIGLLNVSGFRLRQLVVTKDGEVFGGELNQKTIPVLLNSGQQTQIPLAEISRLGYASESEELPEWRFDTPMMFLKSGERYKIEIPTEPISFGTRYGVLQFKPEQVACIDLKTENGFHTIYLSDGSRFNGLMSNPQWKLKLSAIKNGQDVSFPVASLKRVQFRVLPEEIGRGQPTLLLQEGDIVVTRLNKTLKLDTAFDTLELDAGQIRNINREVSESGELRVTLFDQSTFRGILRTSNLSFRLIGGVEMNVPVDGIMDYENPQPFPSGSMVEQVKRLVEKLGSQDWKEREAAEAGLLGMGSAILGVLQDIKENQPLEVQQRLEGIITRLNKDVTPAPSRLSPPPVLE